MTSYVERLARSVDGIRDEALLEPPLTHRWARSPEPDAAPAEDALETSDAPMKDQPPKVGSVPPALAPSELQAPHQSTAPAMVPAARATNQSIAPTTLGRPVDAKLRAESAKRGQVHPSSTLDEDAPTASLEPPERFPTERKVNERFVSDVRSAPPASVQHSKPAIRRAAATSPQIIAPPRPLLEKPDVPEQQVVVDHGRKPTQPHPIERQSATVGGLRPAPIELRPPVEAITPPPRREDNKPELVIGRLTVEVVNPPAVLAPSAAPSPRRSERIIETTRPMSRPTKLRFGLGQM